MKKRILISTLLLCSTVYAKDDGILGANNVIVTTTLPPFKRAILTFSSDFTGDINGICVGGTLSSCGGGQAGDGSLTFEAPPGDTIVGTVVTRTAGNFRYFLIR